MSLRLSRSLAPLLRPTTRRTRTSSLLPRLPSSPQCTRTYATPSDPPAHMPALPADLLSKFQKSPKILEQMQVLVKLFEAKGLATHKPPSMMEMAKLALDKELMVEVGKLAGLMQEEGLMGDLQEVLKGMGMGKGK